ncbi:MAG: CHAT domain-containing tetratricopeptide repeat protein [Cytophagales bacterium]|nr:CHAT domain-containing tetratricopeptide repeat protein [Cytophagales bacterium]
MNKAITYLLVALFTSAFVNLAFCQSPNTIVPHTIPIDSALFQENPKQALEESINQVTSLFQAGKDSIATQYSLTYCDLLEKAAQINYAQNLAKTVKELAPKNSQSETIALSLFGTINSKLGIFDQAKQDLEKALELSDQINGDQSDQGAEIMANLASVYMRLGGFQEALSYYQQSLTIKESLFGIDDPGTRNTHDNIGIIHTYMGRFDEAIKSQNRGIELLRQQPKVDSVELATSYSNLAFSYGQMGDSYEALSLYMKNLEISRRHLPEGHYLVVRAYNNVGAILTRMGDFNRALNFHKEALNLIQSNNENVSTPDLGVTYVNLGACSLHAGDHEKGLYYYKKALNFDLKSLPPTHPYIAEDLSFIGDSYFDGAQYDSAIFYHRKALDINLSQFGPKHQAVATSYNNLSKDYEFIQDYEAALDFSDKAIAAAQNNQKVNHKLAQTINRKVQVLLENGDAETAQKELQRAFIANATDYHSTSPLDYPKTGQVNIITFITSLTLMNEALCDLSEPLYTQITLNSHLQLIDFIDSLVVKRRLSYHHFDDKIYFSKTSSEFYKETANHLIKLYVTKGHPQFLERAYLFTIKSNNAILRENLTIKAARQFAGIPEALNARESRLKSLVSFYQNQLNRIQESDSTTLPTLQKKLFEYEEELIKLNDSIASSFPEYYQLINPKQVSMDGILKSIHSNQLLIEYFLSDSTLHIFQLSENQIQHSSINYDETIKSAIEELINQINSPFEASSITTFKQVSHHLYEKLLSGPLSGIGENIEEVVLIPSYDLPPFPFDVLLSDTTGSNYNALQYALKKFNFSYAYSAEIKYQKQVETARAIAFAPGFDPDDTLTSSGTTLTALYWNKSEVEGVKTHFSSEIYTDEAATEQILKSKQSEFSILHFATHAVLDPENPINSRIAFSKDKEDKKEDGYLHVFEILNMNINANLSVLSACNTGLGEYQKGEGIMSLARAFTYAGCQSVLLSHWSIDDQSTPQLMDQFYANLKAGKSKSSALRNAKLSFLETASEIRSHPYYWSGLSIYGDINPIQPKSNKQLMMIVFTMAFLGLVLAAFNFRRRKIAA